jgi:uncharacterized membrane protein YozB (DUF420 family)
MSVQTAPASSPWPIAGLLLFAALPLTFGVLRLLQFAGLAHAMPELPEGLWIALPVAIHICGAALYAILGAFQFSAAIRRRWPARHRATGRIAIAGGVLVALSALWLTFNYATPTLGGTLLACVRVVFASGLLASLFMGLAMILRRDVPRHRAWMIRAYALALGAATQMIVLMLGEIVAGGPLDELRRALLMGLAWSLNLAVAEWLIRRRARAAAPRVRVQPAA